MNSEKMSQFVASTLTAADAKAVERVSKRTKRRILPLAYLPDDLFAKFWRLRN